MTNQQISILARIAAAQARVAGMQAENEFRVACGNGIAYAEDSFLIEANHLENLAQGLLTP